MTVRDDTIVAISTAPGRGAIALVRLSGPQACSVARALAEALPQSPRTPQLVRLQDRDGATIDRGVATWYAAPASYTGEDVVEFAVHGGAMVPALTVAACVAAGARLAEPGEFTERAVLHGKLDLVQAEAVADVIDARSRAAHRAAMRQLDGGLSRQLSALRDALLEIDALIAYEIDFPEEDEGPLPRERVLRATDDTVVRLEQLLATVPLAQLGREGALVVLAGAPNAGKSSLLNALVGESRVLVSDQPGTTRDAIEVLVDASPVPWRLVDTAGLREGGDALERMGIEVSERYLAAAHVVIACAEKVSDLEALVSLLAARTRGAVLPVQTKSDLSTGPSSAELSVSAQEGKGIDKLVSAINKTITSQYSDISSEIPLVSTVRQEQAIRLALDELRAFRAAWSAAALPAPVAATHLRAATTALETLIGSVDVEDVLDQVFRRFCIGK